MGKRRDWQTGLILDYEKSRSVYQLGSTTTAQTDATVTQRWPGASVHADTTAETTNYYGAVKTTDLFIVGQKYIYEVEDSVQQGSVGWLGLVAELVRNRKHGCRFVIGEDIKFAQEKGHLYVIDPDGKECKAEVVRQEKLK